MEQITIKEIAQICGVAVSTVSRAMNNHPDINQETRQKIMDTIAQYNYVPNNSARNLKRAEARVIAVLVKGISNPFFGTIIQVLEKEIVKKRYAFYLQAVGEQENEITAAIQLEKEKRLKGIVFLGGLYQHPAEDLKKLTVPAVVVTVNMVVPEGIDNVGVVSIDDERESYRIVDALCHKGYRKIAIMTVGGGDASVGSARLNGYRKALEDNGIPVDEKRIFFMPRDDSTYTIPAGFRSAKLLLQQTRDMDCLYCIADTLAIGAMRAVFDLGMRVPDDIAVVGFDGTEMAEFYHPSITTVSQPREEMASAAVGLLFDMIRGVPVKDQRMIFEASLKEGESTAGTGC